MFFLKTHYLFFHIIRYRLHNDFLLALTEIIVTEYREQNMYFFKGHLCSTPDTHRATYSVLSALRIHYMHVSACILEARRTNVAVPPENVGAVSGRVKKHSKKHMTNS